MTMHPARLMGPEARTTPRWLPIALGIFLVGHFVVPLSMLDVVQFLLLGSMLPMAWLVGRPGADATD